MTTLTTDVERGTFHIMPESILPEALASRIRAQADYAAVQANVETALATAQQRRESAMRRVAALGLSHRRIGELTGLSHTRVNQILGTGTKRPPQDVHFPPGFLPPPTTVALGALRVIGEEGPRAWRAAEITAELKARDWPSVDVRAVLVELVAEGVLLSVDGGYFTLHGYGYPGQQAPTPIRS
jgi:hypothetical protein